MMLIGSNSREVVHAVKARLAEIQKELPEGVEIRSYYDRAEFIGRMLKTVAINLAEGAVLVAVVLFLTLGSLRGSLIAALAIPLSMGIALIGMVRMSVTGNLMSLGAIDFGLLVDGAIVMLEVALVEMSVRQAQDARGRRVPGRAVDEQGGAAGGLLAAHHLAGVSAADGAGRRRGADVQADGDHRGARRWAARCCSR